MGMQLRYIVVLILREIFVTPPLNHQYIYTILNYAWPIILLLPEFLLLLKICDSKATVEEFQWIRDPLLLFGASIF